MSGKLFVFSLKQHVGTSALPQVSTSDEVQRGQLLAATPKEHLGSFIYSSIAGTVTSVTDKQVVIRADGSQKEEYQKIPENDPLQMIKTAGIVGLGGAGFPTYMKLKGLQPGGTLLINAAECEPILFHNMERIKNNAAEIIKGIEHVMDIIKAESAIIAIKAKHKEEIECLKQAGLGGKIRIQTLRDLYPMGEERAIIRDSLGVLLDVHDLPSKINALVLNVETVFRIYEAIELRKPMISKDLTLAGRLSRNDNVKVLLDIPLGEVISDILETYVPDYLPYGELIEGGPFTGKSVKRNAPIIKTTNGILATIPFPQEKRKLGLLVCACGADEERMKEITKKMGTTFTGVEYCKNAIKLENGRYKCVNPGECPGQVEKVLKLKKSGADALLIGNCSDCSNTVMTIAPKLKIPVYHTTDFALRGADFPVVRKLKKDQGAY